MDWRCDFIEAKYHLSIANRMLDTYEKYPEKRILIGIINESAKASAKLVRSFLIFDNTKGNLRTFIKNVAPKYLEKLTIEHIVKMLEIERAQKISPIEFTKGDKIILLINGKYRILTTERLKEFVKSIDEAIRVFDGICRQV
jgi:hypothetical protein